MERDTALGVGRIRALGGRIIAQDLQTASVWGMPDAAIDDGPGDLVPSPLHGAREGLEVVSQESKE